MIPPAFLDELQSGAVAVTANRRLSRTMRKQFDQRQTDLGKKAWQAPQILPWDAWLTRHFQQLRSLDEHPYHLLRDEQSLYLWRQIVTNSDSAGQLLNTAAAASIAQSAWDAQQNWGLGLAGVHLSSDQRVYAEWARAYQLRCRSNYWIDTSCLSAWLARRIDGDTATLPERLLVVGFDGISPAQTALLEVLANSGVEILVDDLPGGEAADATLLPCEDEYGENLAVANWAREQLGRNAKSRIGIVVPDLTARRATLLKALDENLAPGSVLNSDSRARSHYNISLGLPLADYPMIDDALNWLALICRPQTQERCTRLLLSPYLVASSSERYLRAGADFQLRRRGLASFSMHAMAGALRRLAPHCPENLCSRLVELIGYSDELPPRQSCSAWSRCIADLLERLGWPGDATLSSEEFQLLGAWQQVLQRLAGFDTVGSACSLSEALAHLATLARGTVFQIESTADARLQVIGLLEVTGMHFDAMWVMGMDEQSWPPRPRLNPLLPIATQRAAGLPHSSAEWEEKFARRSLDRLLGCADEVIFSYAANDREALRSASPLLAHLPLFELAATARHYRGPSYELWTKSDPPRVEHRVDTAPSLAPGSAVRGGVGVLSDQAECPFRGFARHRLCAEPLDQPHTGISASERGSILHAAMEFLWGALKSREMLVSLDGKALRAHIEKAVNSAMKKTGGVADSEFRKLECAHLIELIEAWLALEKRREPFEVESLEQRHTIEIGGLSLELQVDRSDHLAGGGRLLIDYKTGVPSSQDWMKSRPRDVQLPLYVLADPQPVAAVALAHVRPQQSTFAGVSEAETGLRGVALCTDKFRGDGVLQFENWSALRRHWRAELTDLAREFVAGTATVTPRNFPSTCKFCAFDVLCRVRDSPSPLWGGGDE